MVKFYVFIITNYLKCQFLTFSILTFFFYKCDCNEMLKRNVISLFFYQAAY